MKEALAADLQRLLKLQEEDTRLQKVLDRIAYLQLGWDVQGAEKTLADLQAQQQEVEEKLQEARLLASRREGEAEDHHKERERLEARMYSGEIVNVNEVDKLQAQITHLQTLAATAEEEALTAMENIEQLVASGEELTEKITAARRSLARVKEQQQEGLAAAMAEESTLRARRDEAAAAINDGALLSRYRRLLERRGLNGLAVVPVKRGACGGCAVSLAMGLLSQVRKMDALHTCQNCGRGLVYVS